MTSEIQEPRVLLVDDEIDFLDATAKALRRRGFQVTTASDGLAVLTLIEKISVDVIVLDVKMPKISGYDLFKELKKKLPDIQIIFLTGHGTAKKAFETSKEGAFGYLAKPCAIEDLAEMIREAYKNIGGESSQNRELIGAKESENIRLLVIDDEKEFLDSVRKVLSRREMEVLTAENGEKGIDAILTKAVDVVVLDIKMPGMSGIEVLTRIKQEKPLIEVILLTGHASVSTAVDGLKKGAFDYLHKPQNIDDLTEIIRKAAEKKWKSEADERSKRIKEIIEGNPT